MGSIVDPAEVFLEMGLSASVSEEERAITLGAITKAEGAVKRFLGYDPVQRLRTEFYPMQDYSSNYQGGVWEASDTQAFFRRTIEEATSELLVRHIPIRALPAIDLRIDIDARSGTRAGSFAAETLRVEGEDYWPNYDQSDSDGSGFCSDGMFRSFGLWPTEAGSVRIIYTAGYTNEEMHGQDASVDASPIYDAVMNESRRLVEKAFVRMKTVRGFLAGPITSESLGDYSYSADGSLAAKLYGDAKDLMDASKMALESFVNMGWRLAS